MRIFKNARSLALLGLCLLPLGALAQPAVQTEFPEGAVPMPAEALSERLGGKVFRIKFANGNVARIDYRGNGYAFLDMSTGFRDSGKWRVDGTTICTEWRQGTASCSEARLKGDTIFVKRVLNGEIIFLSP